MRVWVLLLLLVGFVYGNIADWQKIETLEKAWKIEEAKALKENTITKVTKLYLNEFDKERYKVVMKKKIDKLDPNLQWVFLKTYEVWIQHISNPKLQTRFSMYLLTFFDKYNSQAWNSEKYAKNIQKRIPWLPTELTDTLISFGKESNNLIKERIKQGEERIKQGEERIKQDDKDIKQGKERIKQGEERIKQGEERIKQGEERIKQRNKLLWKLNSL